MKICPNCKTEYGDEMNFCLTDGSTLKHSSQFSPEDTISLMDNATLEYKSPQTAEQNKQTNLTDFAKPPRKSLKWVILSGIVGLILLVVGTIGGGIIYLRYLAVNGVDDFPRTPTRTPLPSFSPYRTPQAASNLKVEILEKVKSNDGQNYLKCKITNVGENIARPFSMTLQFYKDDVVIKETSAFVELKYLKPQQSVPVWVNLYGTENYTLVKVKESGPGFPVSKSEQQLLLDLNFTETKMSVVYSTSYKVEGIVENQNYGSISPELFVIFYDENSEIIGIETRRLNNLEKNVKTKFDVTINNRDLFGKPKTFEIITVAE